MKLLIYDIILYSRQSNIASCLRTSCRSSRELRQSKRTGIVRHENLLPSATKV